MPYECVYQLLLHVNIILVQEVTCPFKQLDTLAQVRNLGRLSSCAQYLPLTHFVAIIVL